MCVWCTQLRREFTFSLGNWNSLSINTRHNEVKSDVDCRWHINFFSDGRTSDCAVIWRWNARGTTFRPQTSWMTATTWPTVWPLSRSRRPQWATASMGIWTECRVSWRPAWRTSATRQTGARVTEWTMKPGFLHSKNVSAYLALVSCFLLMSPFCSTIILRYSLDLTLFQSLNSSYLRYFEIYLWFLIIMRFLQDIEL